MRPDWTFEDFVPQTSIKTIARTVGEADLNAFVGLAGFFEPLFIDAIAAERSHFARRVIPGQLTFVLAEGLLVLTGAFHHGLAFLGVDNLSFVAPVACGDTIRVEVVVTSARPTSKSGRGIVALDHRVYNADGVDVLTYRSTRMIAAKKNGAS